MDLIGLKSWLCESASGPSDEFLVTVTTCGSADCDEASGVLVVGSLSVSGEVTLGLPLRVTALERSFVIGCEERCTKGQKRDRGDVKVTEMSIRRSRGPKAEKDGKK